MTTQNKISEIVLEYIRKHPRSSSKEIHDGAAKGQGYATTKRLLTRLEKEHLIATDGKGKNTKYILNPGYALLHPVNLEDYYKQELDDREIIDRFKLGLMAENSPLARTNLFNKAEKQQLEALQQKFKKNIAGITTTTYQKEFERLAIDLSWKSSQIEGNTYSLLETERLLKEKETAQGKPKDDATMLLNHKDAIEFIVKHPDYIAPLTVPNIEDIHSLLIKDLGVSRNVRQGRVGISGTNYKPLDNQHQIKEAMEDMCRLINSKPDIFEKALLALALLSYIQPFEDGNKRTARIVANGILIAHHHCPLSFRTVDPVEYKKAMLLFYEQNNISALKAMFIEQYDFAVNTYF